MAITWLMKHHSTQTTERNNMSDPKAVDADGKMVAALRALTQLREQRKAIDEQEKQLTDLIKEAAGDGDTIFLVNGKKAATVSQSIRRTIDTKRFKADYPDLAETLMVESVTRRLVLADPA
jgi:predicted phage-related endonuclease